MCSLDKSSAHNSRGFYYLCHNCQCLTHAGRNNPVQRLSLGAEKFPRSFSMSANSSCAAVAALPPSQRSAAYEIRASDTAETNTYI